MSRTVHLALGVLAVLTALLAVPPVSAATGPTGTTGAAAAVPPGTIVFVKAHDVWIARGDGSGARRVTTTGTATDPWSSPTQSDGGVIAAARGALLYRMDQWGNVKNVIDPPALVNTAGERMDGPLAQVAISPDGTRIAYTYTRRGCPTDCATRSVTGYTDATTTSPPSKYGSTPFDTPSWVTNQRTLVGGGYHSQINLHDVGRGEAVHWFDDDEIYSEDTDLGNAELSRDGRFLAAVRGYGDEQQIIWYAVDGDARTGHPALPTPLCWTGRGAGITDPTWAPDGSALAFEQPAGIEIAHDIHGCTSTALTLPGGAEPSWSRAALSTQRPSPVRLRATARPTIAGAARARAGRTVRATPGRWTPAATGYAYQWYRNGRAIRRATTATYRVVKGDRGKRLTVRVVARRAGFLSGTATSAAVKIRR